MQLRCLLFLFEILFYSFPLSFSSFLPLLAPSLVTSSPSSLLLSLSLLSPSFPLPPLPPLSFFPSPSSPSSLSSLLLSFLFCPSFLLSLSLLSLPPSGTLPPRRNPYASHANAIRMPVFELLQMIFTDVSVFN